MLKTNKLFKRLIYTLIGVILIGVGIALLRYVNLGTDPFSSLVIGVATTFNLSFWYVQMFLLALLLIIVILFNKTLVGVGTLINLIFLGYIADSTLSLIGTISLKPTIYLNFFGLLIAMISICIGVALFMNASLGIASYDALGIIIEQQTNGKLKFNYNRIATDLLCVVSGYFLGSTIGIGTVITALFFGPLISLFKKIFII